MIYEADKILNDQSKYRELLNKFPKSNLDAALEKIRAFQRGEIAYTGDCCMECGSTKLKRTGTCHVCELCGASQGCS